MHTIAVLALPGVIAFDLTIPCEVFARVQSPAGGAAYVVRLCGEQAMVQTGAFEIRVPWGLALLAEADTIFVPGTQEPTAPVPEAVAAALRAAAARGARIASICSGAFVLAACGLLDGLRATTHWLGAAALAQRYPRVEVDPGVLFVDNGRVLTSAGAAAGLDLCLHMVRRDLGAAVAAQAARLAVMPLERDGGQAQFIVHATPASSGSLQPVLVWMQQRLQQPLSLADIARQACTSTRTLSRRFVAQTGATPLQWLLSARLKRARELLETSRLSLEQIATAAGFGGATALRAHFARHVGTSPQRYRRSFGAAAGPVTRLHAVSGKMAA